MSSERETGGDFVRVGDMPLFERIRSPEAYQARLTERKEWEAQNPELAAAWDAAQAEDWEHHVRRLRKGLQRARQSEIMRDLGLPSVKVRICESGLKESPARRAVKTMMLNPEKFFLILGGAPGCGKTIAAVEAALDRAKAGVPGCFVQANRLSQLGFADDEKRLAGWARAAPFLVLDDLGSEALSERWLANLYELIDYRYGRGLKTIITTNLPAMALAGEPTIRSRYGDRIAERMGKHGSYSRCGTESLRKSEGE